MDKKDEKLVKESGLTEKELRDIRESFKQEYAIRNGWNPNMLTPEQLNEIAKQVEWNMPMVKS